MAPPLIFPMVIGDGSTAPRLHGSTAPRLHRSMAPLPMVIGDGDGDTSIAQGEVHSKPIFSHVLGCEDVKGVLVNVVIPRPSPNGEIIPGVGKYFWNMRKDPLKQDRYYMVGDLVETKWLPSFTQRTNLLKENMMASVDKFVEPNLKLHRVILV